MLPILIDIIVGVIITVTLVLVIYSIARGKLHRAIISLIGAAVVYLTLLFTFKASFGDILGYILGTSADNFANFHSILLIFGMMLIVQVCSSAGVFQFLAFYLVQKTEGNPTLILIVICGLSAIMSAILNNILTVLILIPIIIQISRILNIDPEKYIISAAIFVNVGGIFFQISSIPNILITNYFNISFFEFFISVGLFSMVILGISIIVMVVFFRKSLKPPPERLVKFMKGIVPWNLVHSRSSFLKAAITLIAVMVLFMLPLGDLTGGILSTDVIALIGGVVLLTISGINVKESLKNIDYSMLVYLMAIFVVVGGLEAAGIVQLIATIIRIPQIFGVDMFVLVLTVVMTLWLSAGLSSLVDNIPITQALLPVLDIVTKDFSFMAARQTYYSLAFGANLGDNLTPMGDNILVMNIAEEGGRPISAKSFFKIGFFVTLMQLGLVTLYLVFILIPIFGGIITLIVCALTGAIILGHMMDKKYNYVDKVKTSFRKTYKLMIKPFMKLKKVRRDQNGSE